MKWLILLCLLAAPATAAALPPGLAEALAAYDNAQTRGDTDALAGLVAGDFILINSNATVEDKPQYLADYHGPGFKIALYDYKPDVVRVWPGGAVISGLLHLRWTQDGKSDERVLRLAHVWRKQRGRWQAVYAQVTRVP